MAAGARARARLPLEALADLPAPPDRDAVALVARQEVGRVAELLPLRRERMAASPFAFYRGTALVMAADLAAGEHSGVTAQLCGDAHVANFGLFGSPERRLLFDLNDFDETLPGPFEWDVKRLVASLELAGRAIGLRRKERRRVTVRAVRAYRRSMDEFVGMSDLDVWYSSVDVDEATRLARASQEATRATQRVAAQARRRTQLRSLARLSEVDAGTRRFVADPPLVQPLAHLQAAGTVGADAVGLTRLIDDYRGSLQPDRRRLLAGYRVVDVALKVVGVGSVGTRCWILLLQGVDADDALVLQAKEASASVLEPYLGASTYAQHGERVVQGQRLMQASSDLMLGWQRGGGGVGERDYYVRQLHDWKGGVDVGSLRPEGLLGYGRLCAWVLARAHARSGDRYAVAGYLGSGATADEPLADFAAAYADRAERDHAAFVASAAPVASAASAG